MHRSYEGEYRGKLELKKATLCLPSLFSVKHDDSNHLKFQNEDRYFLYYFNQLNKSSEDHSDIKARNSNDHIDLKERDEHTGRRVANFRSG